VMDRQKNVLQIEALATEAITSAVRTLLPVKQILRDYMDEEEDVDDEVVAAAAGAVDEAEADAEEIEEKVEPKVKAPIPVVATAPATPSAGSTVTAPALATLAPAAPVAPAPPATEAEEAEEAEAGVEAVPAIVKIDTENAVTFSNYDDVYEEGANGPEMRYTPKGEEDEDEDEGPSDGMLDIDEASARGLDDNDAIDLDAPVAPIVIPVPPALKKATIDDDCEMLE
jgi:hypothetical protein